ncbi:MAG: 6-bladed beta-propeller, partial [Longimicrobiales bacterium]
MSERHNILPRNLAKTGCTPAVAMLDKGSLVTRDFGGQDIHRDLVVHFRVIPSACLIAAAALPTGGTALHAQTVLTERTCTGCAVRLQHDIRLGKAHGPGLIAASDVIARDHRSGMFYISQHFDQGVISVFDSLGAFVRAIGRPGRGPGEFLQIMDLAVADGRLFAFDSRNRRMTVLTQRDSVAATVPLMGSARPAGSVVFPGAGRIVLASHVRTPELFGHA